MNQMRGPVLTKINCSLLRFNELNSLSDVFPTNMLSITTYYYRSPNSDSYPYCDIHEINLRAREIPIEVV
jgi:hypothetical protein